MSPAPSPDGAIVVHGIPNCDTVKKARAWLAAQAGAVPVRFHDLRRDGVPDALPGWIAEAGLARLVNRSGTTWRRLDEAARAEAAEAGTAQALLRREPTLIRRPVVRWPDGRITVGFDPSVFEARLAGR